MKTFKQIRETAIKALLKKRKTAFTQKEKVRVQQELNSLGYFENN